MALPLKSYTNLRLYIHVKLNMPSISDLMILSILICCLFELICSAAVRALPWLDVVRLLVEQNGWVLMRVYEAHTVWIAMVRLEAYHGRWIMVE